MEWQRWLAVATAMTLLASTAVVVPDQGAAAPATTITETASVSGVDTYVLSVTSTSDLTFTQKSKIVVTGAFDKADRLQRISAMVGTVQGHRTEDCGGDDDHGTSAGYENDDGSAEATVHTNRGDPCFIGLYGSTIEDASAGDLDDEPGDAKVTTGPLVDLTAEAGHDHGAFESLTTGVVYGEGVDLPGPGSDSTVTYRFIVTVPAAESIDVNVDLHLDGDNVQATSTTFEGGFAFWGTESGAAGADVPGANAWYGFTGCGQGCGDQSVPLRSSDPSGTRLYGAMGPTWGGHYILHDHVDEGWCVDCLGPIPTAATGSYGVSAPPGEFSQHAILSPGVSTGGAPLPPPIRIVGADSPGWYTFWINAYAGTGNQDLLAVGTIGVPP